MCLILGGEKTERWEKIQSENDLKKHMRDAPRTSDITDLRQAVCKPEEKSCVIRLPWLQ